MHTKTKSFRSRNESSFSRVGNSHGRNRTPNKSSKKSQFISPENFIKKSITRLEENVVPAKQFESLPLDSSLRANISAKGYINMTEIQSLSADHLIQGKDLIGIASTGTGKTGAFLIPLIQNMLTSSRPIQALILVPTRELAVQVQEEFESLTKGMGMHSVTLIGGTNLQKDMQRLNRPFQVVIGTPGRTTDMINRGCFRSQKMSVLILDEFDRMLDMGFSKEVLRIADTMNNRSQTVLFSATENKKLQPMLDKILNQPVLVRARMESKTSDNVNQDIIRVMQGQEKFNILLDLIKQEEFRKVLIFSETKRGVMKLAKKLKGVGIGVDEIHGDRSQSQRNRALENFRSGRVKVLTATDVAARGLDIDDISHVINYQAPGNMESYIHRIGRTGRAGKTGHAITLID